MKRTTVVAIGLAAALVSVPTAVGAQSGQSDQAAATHRGDSEIDYQTMHNQMAEVMGKTVKA